MFFMSAGPKLYSIRITKIPVNNCNVYEQHYRLTCYRQGNAMEKGSQVYISWIIMIFWQVEFCILKVQVP